VAVFVIAVACEMTAARSPKHVARRVKPEFRALKRVYRRNADHHVVRHKFADVSKHC
jgi:hypothetical protein